MCLDLFKEEVQQQQIPDSSNVFSRSDGVPYLQKVLPSLGEAISYVTNPPVSDQIEKVFVMGGGRNYDVRTASDSIM